MQTALFDFDLPEQLIAESPANPRDSSRLLVVNGGFSDHNIRDFASYLRPNDIVVMNDTRVIPARLIGRRGLPTPKRSSGFAQAGEAKLEVLLHKKISLPRRGEEYWSAFAKPAKRLKIGDTITFAEDFSADVLEKREDGQIILAFSANGFSEKLARHGLMPLPPYIEKKRNVIARNEATRQSSLDRRVADAPRDDESYQTIYAQHDGSVAAPTAGLHFTPGLLAALPCPRAHVTLHVGGGTFLPVKADDTSEHKMHSEWAQVSKATADAVNAAKAAGGRVIAVGTTSLRTLESATDDKGIVQPFEGETDIFITPGYKFKCVDMLLTNFHLPRSTLFMLVSAFAGLEKMHAAYAHAIAQQYRFYSYGDACLLSPA